MDIMQYKCGYCGFFINSQCINLWEHECFGHYNENMNDLVSDENNVLTVVDKITRQITIKNKELDVNNIAWEELLIKYVQDRPPLYDIRLPLMDRTNGKKQNLWLEISNLLRGKASVDEIKAKWKYLRDCYLKAKKKVNQYKPSGSASQGQPDPGFRYYSVMKFLDDSIEKQSTISSISIQVPVDNLSPTTNSEPSPGSSTTLISPSSELPTPKKKKPNERSNMEKDILEALSTPTPTDGVDGFLIRIGESLRRFPYRERARLEIDILNFIYERECELNL